MTSLPSSGETKSPDTFSPWGAGWEAVFAKDRAPQLAFHAASALGVCGTEHNGPEDALRHAIWNALMAQEIGKDRAERIGIAHELDSEYPNETLMDLWNNSVGQRIGADNPDATEQEIVQIVIDAYNRGELRILRQTGFSPVSGGLGTQLQPTIPRAGCLNQISPQSSPGYFGGYY